MRLPSLVPALVAAVSLAPLAPAAAAPQTVLVLVTGDENGHLLPSTEGDVPRGGAAETLGTWTSKEGHCPGKLAKDGAPACKDGKTLVLSTGDHFSGPSISSFFQGEPVAEAMARMGYAASAMGNHELDFGREQFDKLRATGGFPYLSCNVRPPSKKSDKEYDLGLKPFTIFKRGRGEDRRGRAVGGQRGQDGDVRPLLRERGHPYEPALQQAIPAARKAGADVVIVIADECPTVLEPIVAKHPDWKLALRRRRPLPHPGGAEGGHHPAGEPGPPLGEVPARRADRGREPSRRVSGWWAWTRRSWTWSAGRARRRRTRSWPRGCRPGCRSTTRPWARRSATPGAASTPTRPTLFTWYTRAIRGRVGVDVVVLNRKAFRGGVQPGPITPGSVYSVMPFDDSLLTVRLKGKDLAAALENPAAVYDGAVKKDGGGWMVKGKALEPEATYSLATFEYLYFGGDNFPFERMDPNPGETGVVAQTPVIDWTRKQATTQDKPLESVLH